VGSIERLLAYAPQSMYLTHYSRVTGVPRLAEMLQSQIAELVRIARRHAGSADAHGAIRVAMFALWVQLLRRHGCTLPEAEIAELLETDLELNAQGLVVWLERQRKTNPSV
jgi:hypothetical protein